MSKEKFEDVVLENTETENDAVNLENNEIVKEPEVIIKIGIVSNCKKLNVRKNPSKASEVLFVVSEGSEFAIYENESTTEWYKVCTASGREGFCMKQYITIK